MDEKIKQAAALDWAMHKRAQQSGLDEIYVTLMYLWMLLIDEIEAAGRYGEYLQISVDTV